MQELDLSRNLIAAIVPEALKDNIKLKKLNLASNLLQFVGGAFDGLINLESLDLTDNLLSQVDPTWFGNLNKLNQLFLGYNRFESMGVVKISNQNLKFVALDHNRIAECFSRTSLMEIPNIQAIDLNSNLFDSIQTNCFGNLTSLKELFLQNNSITAIGPDAFSQLTKLQFLDLSFNKFQGIPSNAFRQLELVEGLKLDYNPIKTVGPNIGLAKMNKLALLSIVGGSLTTLDPNVLPTNGSSLQQIDLSGNLS